MRKTITHERFLGGSTPTNPERAAAARLDREAGLRLLTQRQRDVVEALASGTSVSLLALRLGISEGAVRSLARAARDRLAAHGRGA